MSNEFDLEQYKRGLTRKIELETWLSGEEPYTPEEQKIASGFGGKSAKLMARQAVALHRKSQATENLSGEGILSEDESKIVNGFGGKHGDLLKSMAVGYVRKNRLVRYLSGDEDEKLDK